MDKVICGDCLDVMRDIPNNSIDLVIADIPYDEVNRASGGLRNLDKGKADVLTFDLSKALTETNRVCSGSFYVFCGIGQVGQIRSFYAGLGHTTRLCIWEKTNPSPMNGQHTWLSGIECFVYAKKSGTTFNEYCKNTVFRYPTAQNKLHPTMKPIKLLEELIHASSNENDMVLDFCAGSGTTGVACRNLNRQFILIEKDPTYYEITRKRIAATPERLI